jgi:hypothetical protein
MLNDYLLSSGSSYGMQQAKQLVVAIAATRAIPRVPTRVNNAANGRPAAPPQEAFMIVFSINDVVE